MENKNEIFKQLKPLLWFLFGLSLLANIIMFRVFYKLNDLDKRLKHLEKQPTEQSLILPNNFDYAYSVLHDFNKKIDTNTVIKIVQTMNKFSLTKNKQTFKLVLGQLLTESSAKHLKNNEILISKSGALGIGQILPNSAYGYLLKYCKDNDKSIFKELGCGDFSFVYNKNLNKIDKIEKIKGWLHNKTNNIALWGFIMKKHLDFTKGDIEKSLIGYSDGIGGMKNYVDSGGDISNHEYIVTINNKLNQN